MLIASLVVAVAAFAGPFVLDLSNAGVPRRTMLFFLEVLPALWGILLLVAFFRYRLRGLWFLFGLPLVSWWPYFLVALALACKHGGGCL